MKYFEANASESGLGFLPIIAIAILVFSVTRGLVPILTHNGNLTQPTYYAATALVVILSSYGLYVTLFARRQTIGKWPRRLLLINFLLFIYWLIPLILFRVQLAILAGFVYSGVIPFSIYALMRVPEKVLLPTLGILTLVIAGFVIYDFVALNTLLIPDGFYEVYQRQALLRSDFESLSGAGSVESGGVVTRRPSGLLGSNLPHDSGNLLAIFFVYWLAILFRSKSQRYIPALLTLIALIGLLLSQSASNILAGFMGGLCVFVVFRKVLYSINGFTVAFFLLGMSAAAAFGISYYDIDLNLLWNWSSKIGPGGDWEAMLNLGPDSPGPNLFAILFGHGLSLEFAPMRIAEYSFLKLVLDLGVIHALLFFTLLFYPVFLFLSGKFRTHHHAVAPYVVAIFVGFLSLWHYGSVLRSTNVLVFFSLYAQALKMLLSSQKANVVSAKRRHG